MARIRTIKPDFWRHPVYGRLPDDVQLLAIALLSMADDEGYFRADAAIIRGDVQPFRDDLAKLSRSVATLSQLGWIELSENVEQGLIGRVTKWTDHQRVDHPKDSKIKKYFTSRNSRETLATVTDNFSLEQGTGNREQGTGLPLPSLKEDRSELVELIARTYPGNKTLKGLMIPHIMEDAIRKAVDAHGDAVLDGTRKFAEVAATYTPHKRQFIRAADKWFGSGGYNEDPAVWIEVKNGEEPAKVIPRQSGLSLIERVRRDEAEAIADMASRK